MDTYPIFFFITLVLLGLLTWEAAMSNHKPWSKPLLVMYATVALWYVGDFIYNDPESFRVEFYDHILNTAFLQVCWFLICLRAVVWFMSGILLRDVRVPPAVTANRTMEYENQLLIIVIAVWCLLVSIALVRTDGDIVALICPPVSTYGFPWTRAVVGGQTDSLISLADYTNLAVCAMFGVLAATAKSPHVRAVALALCFVSFPMYFFTRTRSKMLMIMMPGVMAYLLTTRSPLVRKAIFAVVLFAFVSIWFAIVGAARRTNFEVIKTGNTEQLQKAGSTRHRGLDMYRELCYMNSYFESGRYEPNWGRRYFADLVSIIPRAFWKDKPYIGVDYAIARGFGSNSSMAGASVSIAPGLVGQGVVNFGPIFGPMIAATLAGTWVCFLGRLWIQRRQRTRLILLVVGLGLTANLGREFSPIVLFPFFFATVGILIYERIFPEAIQRRVSETTMPDRPLPARQPAAL